MIASEFLLSASGLGELIIQNTQIFETGKVLAAVLVDHDRREHPDGDRPHARELLLALEGGRVTTAAQPRIVAAPLRLTTGTGTFLLRLATGFVLLLIWEGLVRWLAPSYVARPTGVIQAIPRVVRNESTPLTALAGGFWPSVETTLVAVLEGLVIGVVFGVIVGLAMGRLRDVDSGLRIYVNAFFALPTIAVLPLMTLWFGYSATARLAIIIFGAFMPVCLNVYDGVRRLPTEFIEVSKTFHARWWNVWFGIALPGVDAVPARRPAAGARPRARRRGRRRVPARAEGARLLHPRHLARVRPERLRRRRARADDHGGLAQLARRRRDAAVPALVPEERVIRRSGDDSGSA